MSAKIEEIVEVLEEIRDQFRTPGNTLNIYTLRRRAIITIAARREITVQSVNDKFIRKIRPDINYLPDFDKLIQDWLIHGSTSLQNILSKHATSQHDRELIKNAFYLAPEPDLLLAEEFGLDPNEESFKEGKEKFRLHCTKERNRHLVILAKSLWFRTSGGKIKCSACGFSFQDSYGEIGKGYIEAHHKVPISLLASDTIVKIADLAPVCSNCHSILHRHRPWLAIEDLQKIIIDQKKKFAG